VSPAGADGSSVVVLGAGLCGLSAAYHLEALGHTDYVVLERAPEVGGLARTETFDGFSFDHSIHILYARDPRATALIRDDLLAGNVLVKERLSYCRTAGRYTEYPYQLNNHGLPAEIVADNILGLIEAQRQAAGRPPPPDFAAWIERTFGRGIAERFMLPYNRKLWAWDLGAMNYDWIADRVPVPDLRQVLLGALTPPSERHGPNGEFWYPERGGIEALARAFAARLPPERLRLGAAVAGIEPESRNVVLATGERVPYRHLISTLPLPRLVPMLGEGVPEDVRASAAGLAHNVVHTVSLGLEGERLGLPRPMHWAYYPGEDAVFHRLSFPGLFSPWMVPDGCSSVQAEISESAFRPRDRTRLVEETLAGLVSVGVLSAREARPVAEGGRVRVAEVLTLDPAYVIYTLGHRAQVSRIKGHLEGLSITSRGRFGEWEYLNMDHSILGGREAAERALRA